MKNVTNESLFGKKILAKYALGLFLSICFLNLEAQQYTTGSPGTGGNTIPWAYTSAGVRGQQVYPAGMFGTVPTGHQITKVYWASTSSGSATYATIEIYLKQDNISTLSTTYETGMTLVYSGSNVTVSRTALTYYGFDLQTPFPFDPTLPLIWEVRQIQSPYTSFSSSVHSPTPAGAYRNWSTSISATTASGSGAYALSFGFDIEPQITVPNDAGITSIDSPAAFCSGTKNIVATVRNFGTNQINPVTINWSVNGFPQTPVLYNQTLDTINGTGPNTAQVTLGSWPFTSGVTDVIEAWTSGPNNMVDTVTGNDSTIADKQPSLAGNFTIDPLGSGSTNYLTITDAVNDLNDFGVCGPVTFTIAPGTYIERMAFKSIDGASATNTITFVADTSGNVTVEYGASSATDNSVVEFNGASYITLDGITFQIGSGGSTSYRRLFTLSSAKYNTVQNCHLIGYNSTSSSSNYHTLYIYGGGNDYNKFNDNIIDANSGYYGVYMYGASGNNAKGNEFNRNEFLNAYQYMIYAYYNTDLKLRNNTFRSSYVPYGLYCVNSEGEMEIVGNRMVTGGIYGMYFSTMSGTPTKSPLIANNWVVSGSTSYTYTLYMSNVSFARIANNTIWRNNIASSGYYGIYMTSGAVNTLVNNLVYCPLGTASYYGIYISTAAAVSMIDHNNVWIPTGYYGYYNGAQSTLASWNTATGGSNNYNIDPGFTKVDSLRHCVDELDNTGMALEYITEDIDGDFRSITTPDIGADEFVGSDSSSYDAGPDGELCNGKPVEIGAPITGGTYVWSTSETTPTIMVSQTGNYTVLFTSSCGGSFSDVVEVVDVTPTASFDILPAYHTGKFTNTSLGGGTHRWVVMVSPPDTIWSKNLVYLFDDNGPVEVCLTTYNHCDTVTTCKDWTGFVGVEEGDLASAISVMPNPATDNLSIRFNEVEGDVTVEMHNIQGQVVYTERYMNVTEGSSRSIDVSNLNKGMYLLKLMSNNEVVTKQIVVQ